MNSFNDDIYLVFACRKANQSDTEVDFIIDDEKFVICAVSKANLYNLEEKQMAIEARFPKHKVLITHRPLFNLIETLAKLEQLESAMISDGDLIGNKPTGRIVDALNWENKQDTARQVGRC